MVLLVGPEIPDGAGDPRLYTDVNDLFAITDLAGLLSSTVFTRAIVRHESLRCMGVFFGESQETTEEAIAVAVATERIAIDEHGVVSVGQRHEHRYALSRRSQFRGAPIWDGAWMSLTYPGGNEDTDISREIRELAHADHLGEIQPGVWIRPDNVGTLEALTHTAPESTHHIAATFQVEHPRHTSSQLWDLDGYSERSTQLIETIEDFKLQTQESIQDHLAQAWILLAALSIQIERDPLLPAALLPLGWSGTRLPAALRGMALFAREGFVRKLKLEFPPGS